MLSQDLTSILLAALGGLVLLAAYRILSDPLVTVPGPFLARLTRLWEVFAVSKTHFEQVEIDLHERYGHIVRLAPGRYSISDPDAIKQIYAHGSKFIKSPFYSAFGNPHPELRDLFSEQNINQHTKKRRGVAALYSMTSLLSYEKFVDSCNSELCGKLRTFAETGRSICIPIWMQFYAFDVIGEITVGKTFEYMRTEKDFTHVLKAVHESMAYGSMVGLLPELHPWFAWLAKSLNQRIPFDDILDYLNKQISKREEGETGSTRNDFLTKLLSLREAEKLSNHDVITTLGANIAAGSDTTAISLSSVIYHLLKNPAAKAKLCEEIDSFAKAGKISEPVTFTEAQEMPYLQAVIKEALRIHPATGQMLPRVVPPEGATLGGRNFPGGSVVGVNPWVTHLNEEIFGPDPESFCPERWLDDDPGKIAYRNQSLLSFGAGARTCIGKNISMLEMTKVIPQMYRNFDFKLEAGAEKWQLETVWFVKQKFNCTIELRQKA